MDDNPVNRKVLVRTLQKLGFEADAVENGLEAVRAVQGAEYGAVLMDCHMPVMDGYQATAEIRAGEEAGRRLPIIAVTAHDQDTNRTLAAEAGMDDFLPKPIDRSKLAETLQRWLQPAA